MSGIAGIIHFDGRPVEPGQVEAMTAAMNYRGPDGIHHWTRGFVALGQCMLRTTPESLEETQPLPNEDASLVLVMDGRLDNWDELRSELLGHGARLRTRADAELLLRAYETWGERCVEHVDGDFAFAIWDARRHALFCARDRVGNRQFHYHWSGSSFAFATDLHPVLNLPWVPETQDLDTLAEYLATDWLTIDTTLWQEVKRLKPAHRMSVSGTSKLESVEYWAPDPFAPLPCKTDEDYIAYYRELFFDVVRSTLRSHKPLAIEVSGGLDSSSIFAVAKQLQSEGRLLAPAVHGYTLDFGGDPHADEVGYAMQVGQHHGVCVRPVLPTYRSLSRYAEAGRRFRVFPNFPNGVMHTGVADLAHHAGSRALVSGSGGDEWSDGDCFNYAENLTSRRWKEVFHQWQAEREAFSRTKSIARMFRHGVLPALPEDTKRILRGIRNLKNRPVAIRRDWLRPDLRLRLESLRSNQKTQTSKPVARFGQRAQWRHLCDPYAHFAKGMMELSHANSGLEWRQPYWDRRLIQFAFSSPGYLRNRLGVNRWLHRQAMRGLLPESVRMRQSKAEFDSAFMRGWSELCNLILTDILPRRANWVRPEKLKNVMDLAFSSRSMNWDVGPPWVLYGLDSCCAPNGIPDAFRDSSAVP